MIATALRFQSTLPGLGMYVCYRVLKKQIFWTGPIETEPKQKQNHQTAFTPAYTILNFHQISYTKCLIIVQLIIDLKVEEVLKI